MGGTAGRTTLAAKACSIRRAQHRALEHGADLRDLRSAFAYELAVIIQAM